MPFRNRCHLALVPCQILALKLFIICSNLLYLTHFVPSLLLFMVPSYPWPLGRLPLQSLTPKSHPALNIASSGFSELYFEGKTLNTSISSCLLGPSLCLWASSKVREFSAHLPQAAPARCALPQNLPPPVWNVSALGQIAD